MVAKNILILFLAVGLLGCASRPDITKEISPPQQITKTGKDDRPKWATQETFMEEDGKLIYTGGVIGGADYVLALRLAKAEATKNLLESVQVKVCSEFSTAMHGNNMDQGDIGRYVTDAVAWTVDNLKVGGIKQRQMYYEQTFDPVSQAVKYNAWVQLEISKGDYLKAKTDAAQKILDKAIQKKDEEAKEKAIELLEKLRREA